MIERRITSTLLLVVLTGLLTGCALPSLKDRSQSETFAQEQTADTRLGRAVGDEIKSHPGLSGIATLENPLDAFVARALLAEASDTSLDVQYYIWRDDITGKLLLYSLYRAAERGVRVRLLLDDNGIAGMDDWLAALNHHDNVEVRLFNPFVIRSSRTLGFLTDFGRLNHRMHNKSFTADNQATIIGGRNIADEYFGVGGGALFSDLDVLAIGPVVGLVSRDFDRYWASQSAYPVDRLLSEASDEDLDALGTSLAGAERNDEARRFVAALQNSEFFKELLGQELAFVWAPVEMVSDDPAKAQGLEEEQGLLSQQLALALGEPQKTVTLVSPYFVPGNGGVELFRDLENAGVEVRILTNSLEANDVALVHSGYAKYRKSLLQAGVELFELRKFRSESEGGKPSPGGIIGSSAASLHAKTFAVDGETLFVGSFNFDPRSANLNTELGFLIRSRELAKALESAFPEQVRLAAYEVVLDDEGELRWLAFNGTETVEHRHEPNIGAFKRALVYLFSLLPVEPLL
ncbi:Phosphatidylserine/phosphatidylglycerophosphate/cardiolipin synthase [Marinobacter sp. es.048]|uniref:phospholipase D family protein n=1 Tax=Marinobacter sp. es.048 TaxID=1761795 RepID=UPI000B58FBB5|nr:phospholipase D family protein [Marinobacter sp. es.048]SNC61601.1 Phosphatidylserine/phosphatidylglycerophosphate/cardiolipin synthase [Marinobacter sp. es.048]